MMHKQSYIYDYDINHPLLFSFFFDCHIYDGIVKEKELY